MPDTSNKSRPGHSQHGEAVRKEDVPGPVPLRHRNRLGQDVIDNPQGTGKPSTKSTIQNTGGKGW